MTNLSKLAALAGRLAARTGQLKLLRVDNRHRRGKIAWSLDGATFDKMRKLSVTMREVAQKAGVSPMTVSRALREDSPVSEETRKRILRVVKELNYVPDQVAGSLSSMRSGFVAVLVPSLNNLHFAGTVQALTRELEKYGRHILLGYTDYSRAREERLVETMLGRRPEAVVLSYDGHNNRTTELLRGAGVPVVELWERPESPIDHTIGISNEDAAFRMTSTLIDMGYHRLTFLCETDDDWTRGASRRRGFLRATRKAGFPDDRILRVGKPPLSIEDGAAARTVLKARFPDTDCVFCVSDPAAFGLLCALRADGVSVPDEIGIAGFGNFEMSRFSSPSISTVDIDPEEIGVAAGQLIGRFLTDPTSADDPVRIEIKATVLLRESTTALKRG